MSIFDLGIIVNQLCNQLHHFFVSKFQKDRDSFLIYELREGVCLFEGAGTVRSNESCGVLLTKM